MTAHAHPDAAPLAIKLRVLRWVLVISLGLTVVKFYAYWLTGSAAILSDALESIVNLVATSFALYSIRLASLPRDHNHPYGHGKIEYFAAGFEGSLIALAALGILFKSVQQLLEPVPLHSLPLGLALTGLAGAVNLLLGFWLVRTGRQLHSLTLVADGRHILSDSYTSAGLLVGLALVHLTGLWWLDAAVAALLALVLAWTGYGLIRQSIRHLMDEQDTELLARVAVLLQTHRHSAWIDIHNLRIQTYGPHLHLDCHLTLPWYYDLQAVQRETAALEALLSRELPQGVEIFVHTDPCLPNSCAICSIQHCAVRQAPQKTALEWSVPRLTENVKHNLEGERRT